MSTNTAVPKYLGTMIRGANYVLFDPQTKISRHYKPGEKWVFSEADMLHLEEHAIHMRTVFDHMTGEAIGEPVGLFEFEEFTGPEPAGHRFPTEEELKAAEAAKTARARSRRVALAKAEVDGKPARARLRSRAA